MLRHILFYMIGQNVKRLLFIPDGIQQECASILKTLQHIIFFQIGCDMACHKIRCAHKIRGTNGLIPEPEVRDGNSTRLLGVIGKVGLTVLICGFSNDHDGVFIGSHRTIGPQTVKLAFKGTFWPD